MGENGGNNKVVVHNFMERRGLDVPYPLAK